MATKRLPMRQIREILRLKHEQKLSHRAIAGACRVGLGTVADYLGRARQAGLEWPLPEELDEAALEARLFPRAGPGSRERVAPDVERIHQELKRVGVTLHLLWEEYREANPKGYAYSQFCKIYRRWAQKLTPSMRQVHRAGEKTFIDFSGKRPQLTNPPGEAIPAELFVAVLGASGYTYAEATPSQQLPDWVGVHIRMVEFFGGSSRIWVPDQLKSAITQPCRYEAGVNRTYQDEAEHYGAVVIPARAAESSGQSESGIDRLDRTTVDPGQDPESHVLQSGGLERGDSTVAGGTEPAADAEASSIPPGTLPAAGSTGIAAATNQPV